MVDVNRIVIKIPDLQFIDEVGFGDPDKCFLGQLRLDGFNVHRGDDLLFGGMQDNVVFQSFNKQNIAKQNFNGSFLRFDEAEIFTDLVNGSCIPGEQFFVGNGFLYRLIKSRLPDGL